MWKFCINITGFVEITGYWSEKAFVISLKQKIVWNMIFISMVWYSSLVKSNETPENIATEIINLVKNEKKTVVVLGLTVKNNKCHNTGKKELSSEM